MGKRFDSTLSSHPLILSRNQAKLLIQQGFALLNGKTASVSKAVESKDIISFFIPPATPSELLPQPYNLTILFEDDDLIVIDKPSGMVVHPAPGHPQDTLVNYLLHHCKNLSGIGGIERLGIVHRLDKDTSGVIVSAKNDATHQSLSEQFKVHSIKRIYHAICFNNPDSIKGIVDQPLGRDAFNRKKMAINPKGKNAITEWKALKIGDGVCLMQLKLQTGRTHQIRVHLSSINLPIAGDSVYGSTKNKAFKKFNTKTIRAFNNLDGQALHAKVLGFIHPKTKNYIEFESDLPENMQTLSNLLFKT